MNITIHPSWELFFRSRQSDLERILSLVAESDYLPQADLIFRFARQDLHATRVVILGQDPYPQPGAATGRRLCDMYIETPVLSGETLTLYVNGTKAVETTDSRFAYGMVGIAHNGVGESLWSDFHITGRV